VFWENGVLASDGDTRFVLIGNLTGTYVLGLPTAVNGRLEKALRLEPEFSSFLVRERWSFRKPEGKNSFLSRGKPRRFERSF
jgi:hypothetical protein